MSGRLANMTAWVAALVLAAMFQPLAGLAQEQASRRIFPQSKATVEKALRQLQASMSGRLPALEGFAVAGEHPLNAYRRGFFQVMAQVNSNPAGGGSVVRLTSKITAWYSDSTAAHSGYQLLASNGRLEADLLDQLADQLALDSPTAAAKSVEKPPGVLSKATSETAKPSQSAPASEPSLSAPMPRLPKTSGTFGSSLSEGLAANARGSSSPPAPTGDSRLEAEAATLEEVLKNQAHPKNLVAVKKSGTPVVSSPSLSAKTLFLASTHDEFEMLNFNRDWVHVRISGLSRGWIWRNSLELPESVPDADTSPSNAPSPAAELFRVSREETAPFPGDWAPLRGKSVKIVSVEKGGDPEKDSGAPLKLEFAKSILDQDYKELAQKSDTLAGIVVIFDSADGGMIAATFTALQQWKAGRLSDAALWHQCFFDPPEIFVPSGSPGSK